MANSEILSGGFINNLYHKNGVVIKEFSGDEFLSSPKEIRSKREAWALRRFGEIHSPRLINTSGIRLEMTCVEGCPMDEIVRIMSIEQKRNILYQAGIKLKEIHEPIYSNIPQFMTNFLQKTKKFARQAEGVLALEGIQSQDLPLYVTNKTNEEAILEMGETVVHRDYWLNNTLFKDGKLTTVVDWELAGIGSPYEDFAIVDLWIIREHGEADAFWEGYGIRPDQDTIDAFLVGKIADFISTTIPEAYIREKEGGGGFYTNKIDILKELL